MTKVEMEKFKKILEAKQAELSGLLRNRDEIVIEKAPDALDEVQLAGERELAIRNLDRDSNMLRQIRRALPVSRTAPMASACIAKRTSRPSASMRCRGPRSASNARNRWIVTKLRSTTQPTCLPAPHKHRCASENFPGGAAKSRPQCFSGVKKTIGRHTLSNK